MRATANSFGNCLLLCGVLCLGGQASAATADVRGEVTLPAPRHVQVRGLQAPPESTAAQRALQEAAQARTRMPGPRTPPGADASARSVAPMDPETPLPLDASGPAAASGNVAAPKGLAVVTPITVFSNLSLAAGPARSQVSEPSASNNGRNILATYNWYSGVSTNDGDTWTYVNPATTFPSANGGFCCDQDTYYDPVQNLTFWLLQYVSDPNGNILRLAVAKGPANLASGTWYYYDFAPENFCSGLSVNSDWFDFPHLARTDNNLYLASNVFTSGDQFRCTTMIRIPLAQLSAGGAIDTSYIASGTLFNFTAAQGGTNTLYFATHADSTHLRVYTWPESTGPAAATFTDVAHAAHLDSGYNCTVTASGKNPCGFDDDRLIAGWLRRSNGELAFLWDAAQGTDGLGTFPYPYVRVLSMNAGTKAVMTSGAIWSNTTAWLLPSGAGNMRGHVGGTIVFAGGAVQPSCAAWLYDDLSTGMIPLESTGVQFGNTSPSTNRWGDYLRTRQSGQNPLQWIGTCYAIETDVVTPRIAQFGRERDRSAACTQDVDGNGVVDALTDGLILIRAMFGLTGTAVTNGATGSGATRTTWAQIYAYLNGNCGTQFAP